MGGFILLVVIVVVVALLDEPRARYEVRRLRERK